MSGLDLRELPTVNRADVYKGDVLTGRLERTPTGIDFGYLPEYLESGGSPVATSLPLTPATVSTPAGAVPPFFAGLLPEGRRLSALRRAVKTSPDDELSLLLAIGSDAVGDVTVVPHGQRPQRTPATVAVDDPTAIDFTEVLAQALGPRPDRVGIPGVQDKVSAQMITLPVSRATSGYILKLNPPEFPALVENEAFFLDAARRSGIETVESTLVYDTNGVSGLLVERFDRTETPDGIVRPLPVEDACQVLGRYPASKYALTSEQVVLGLVAPTRSEAVATLTLLRQFIFAYLTCNGDAHAKNFSILGDPTGEWRVAPAYDLPSSYPYGDHELALSIGGRRRENVTRATFTEFGLQIGLRPRAIHRTVDELIERTDMWIADVDALPFTAQQTRKLKRAIEYRRKQLHGRR